MADESSYTYDIALSYAGEDREVIENIAQLLRNDNIKVFYDQFERAKLWGENLYDHLTKLYSKEARYCLMFISEHYAEKAWTNLER